MANELTAQAQMSWVNGSRSLPRSFNSRFDVAGDNPVSMFPTATTSWAALSLPSNFGTPGWALIKNLSTENYVEIGNNNGGSPIVLIKLLPGEFFYGPLGVAKDAIAVRSNTANSDLECHFLER